MRVLPACLLLLSTALTALARPGGYLHARKPAPVSRALKQHHVLRSSDDTCGHLDGNALQLAAIDINLDLTADILGILLGLDICICISLLPLQVDVGLGLDALIPLLGLGDINALLEAAVRTGVVRSMHGVQLTCIYAPSSTLVRLMVIIARTARTRRTQRQHLPAVTASAAAGVANHPLSRRASSACAPSHGRNATVVAARGR